MVREKSGESWKYLINFQFAIGFFEGYQMNKMKNIQFEFA